MTSMSGDAGTSSAKEVSSPRVPGWKALLLGWLFVCINTYRLGVLLNHLVQRTHPYEDSSGLMFNYVLGFGAIFFAAGAAIFGNPRAARLLMAIAVLVLVALQITHANVGVVGDG
jgi:hypothetical protein